MEETFRHCGAVFVPDTSTGICPHCGQKVRTLFARIRATDKDLVAFFACFIFLGFSAFLLRSFLLSMFAMAQVISVFFESLHKPPIALNLESKKPKSAPVFLSRPTMPGDWQIIALLSRPRDVFISPRAKGELVLSVSIFLVGLGVAVFPHASQSKLQRLAHSPKDGLFELLWLMFWVYFGISNIRAYFVDREILRDGKLTIGVLTEWREGRGGISVSYQFWTDSGQKFERHCKVHSKDELGKKEDPLKVFYLPQDPTKSVALCCTPWHLRRG